jgi:hypothetical protein
MRFSGTYCCLLSTTRRGLGVSRRRWSTSFASRIASTSTTSINRWVQNARMRITAFARLCCTCPHRAPRVACALGLPLYSAQALAHGNIHTCTRGLIHARTHSLIHVAYLSLKFSLTTNGVHTCARTEGRTDGRTHPLTHPSIHPPTYPLTHSPTPPTRIRCIE